MRVVTSRRIGVVGDIHGEDAALERTLLFLSDRRADLVLAVGDVVDGRGDPDRCCVLLREHSVVTVRGNHDRWLLEGTMRDLPDATLEVSDATRAWLAGLPATVELDTDAGRLMLCHGVGDDDMAVLTPDARGYGLQAALDPVRHREDVRIVVGGHTHERMVKRAGPFVFVNPGTLHRDWGPGFALLDLRRRVAELWDLPPEGEPVRAEVLDLPVET